MNYCIAQNSNRCCKPIKVNRLLSGMNLTYSVYDFNFLEFVLFENLYVTSNIITFLA